MHKVDPTLERHICFFANAQSQPHKKTKEPFANADGIE